MIAPTPVLPTTIAHQLPNDNFYHTSPPLILFEVTIKGRKNWEKNRTIKINLKNNKINYLCIFPCFAGDDGSHSWHRKKEEWKSIQIPKLFCLTCCDAWTHELAVATAREIHASALFMYLQKTPDLIHLNILNISKGRSMNLNYFWNQMLIFLYNI